MWLNVLNSQFFVFSCGLKGGTKMGMVKKKMGKYNIEMEEKTSLR